MCVCDRFKICLRRSVISSTTERPVRPGERVCLSVHLLRFVKSSPFSLSCGFSGMFGISQSLRSSSPRRRGEVCVRETCWRTHNADTRGCEVSFLRRAQRGWGCKGVCMTPLLTHTHAAPLLVSMHGRPSWLAVCLDAHMLRVRACACVCLRRPGCN